MQSNNQISLYRKIDSNMAEAAGLEIKQPQLFYHTNEGLKEIEILNEIEDVLAINEFDTEWAPNEHDLIVKQKFIFNNPSVLFGEDGVTMHTNKIGIAVHIHSKTASNQKKFNFGSIVDGQNKIEIPFEYRFPVDSLRGNIEMDFFLYLEKCNETKPFHANKVGMVLSENDLCNLTIIVDGEGSAFPITEFSDVKGPLWTLEKNWADASEDPFDSSSVSLKLNIAHPLFEQVKGGKTRVAKALMGDIMIQAMAMIIQEVLIVEKNTLDSIDESISNSILTVVDYWVSTFEVDTTSLFTIINSLRQNLEQEMIRGEAEV